MKIKLLIFLVVIGAIALILGQQHQEDQKKYENDMFFGE